MLDRYYDTEQPFDDDIRLLARHCRAKQETVKTILDDFFINIEGKWHNPRADVVILAFYAKSAKAAESANARWSKKERNANAMRTHSEGNATAMRTRCEPDATHNPQPTNKENPLSNPDGFDEFWSAYPKKVGKAEAKKLWAKLKVNGRLPSVLSAIAVQKSTAQWQKEGGQFIPLPATWLRQGRWDDEVQKVTPAFNLFAGAI
jgi:uncharacterized protein YdaU (DUF1376 family)